MNTLPVSASNVGLKPFGHSGSGRSVLASNQLHQMLDGFQQISQVPSSEGYHALALTSAVNSLRGGAAPVNSFLKNGSATRRCIVGAGFEIEYELNNYHGGPQTDVVIVDIRITQSAAEKQKRAALWQATSNEARDGWGRAKKEPDIFLQVGGKVTGKEDSPLKIGVNGYCKDLDDAIDILPAHITRGDKAALQKLQDKGYTLFYVPQNGAFKAGWKCVKNMGHAVTPEDVEASRILAGHMKEAHDKGLYVEWTSHRGGSKVLTKAMEQLAINHVNLEGKQKIFLSDATSSQYSADVVRHKIGMNDNDSKWFNSTPGLAQMVGGSRFGTAKFSMSMNKLMGDTGKNGKIDQVIDALHGGHKVYKGLKKVAGAGGAAYGGVTGLTSIGLSSAMAHMIIGVLGGGVGVAGVVLASIPSLNKGYHTPTAPLKQLGSKVFPKK